MTFHHHDGSAGPARLPNGLTYEAEFLLLMDLKRQTEARLDQLAALIAPDLDIMPMSRVRGMAPGALLSIGGRDAGR